MTGYFDIECGGVGGISARAVKVEATRDNWQIGIHGLAILGTDGNAVDCSDTSDGSVTISPDLSNQIDHIYGIVWSETFTVSSSKGCSYQITDIVASGGELQDINGVSALSFNQAT